MEFEDDRTQEQKQTHPIIVLMTDSFMSGWGKAECGPSFAGWACTLDDVDEVERRIRKRSEAKRVRIVSGGYRPKAGPGHCHIYVEPDSKGATIFPLTSKKT